MKKDMKCLIGLIFLLALILAAVPISAMEQGSDETSEAEFI